MLLPAAAWGEKDGTVTNSERRISRQRAFLPPPGEARPDWWIVSEVARRLNFGAAFDYRSPADVFREHAALSAFENGGRRDFDIGALASLSDEAYDALDPVMWPARAGQPRFEQRFFGAGGFFTEDRRARFVAPQSPRLRAATNEAFPLRLNTGRVRDQWHTMTRTGTSPRLSAHSPEPFVEVHPADAEKAKLADGGFARITTPYGNVILKVALRTGQQRGSIFAPIYWSDATAAHARVGDTVSAANDPVSGQPEAKATPVRIEPIELCLPRFRSDSSIDRTAGRDVVRARGCGWRHWTFACDQRTAGILARACTTLDAGRRGTCRVHRSKTRRNAHCRVQLRPVRRQYLRRTRTRAAAMGRGAHAV